jgi:drug/metabolite transporter (DMT)-like permease
MLGVLLALAAMFGWGGADFLAQRAARKVGNVATLFWGSLFGAVVLLPSASRQVGMLAGRTDLILLIALGAAVSIATALFSLEAYRRGKLVVVEPILGLELPFTILLAVALRGERLDGVQAITMTAIFIGVVLAATVSSPAVALKKQILEKGSLLGLAGMFGFAALNFLTGVISQEASPIIAVWSGRAVASIVIGAYLAGTGRLGAAFRAARGHPLLVLGVSALYLVGFMAYGMAATHLPISVATAISEGYVVLTVLLGVIVNKEKVARHQFGGIAVVTAAVMILGYLSA